MIVSAKAFPKASWVITLFIHIYFQIFLSIVSLAAIVIFIVGAFLYHPFDGVDFDTIELFGQQFGSASGDLRTVQPQRLADRQFCQLV